MALTTAGLTSSAGAGSGGADLDAARGEVVLCRNAAAIWDQRCVALLQHLVTSTYC